MSNQSHPPTQLSSPVQKERLLLAASRNTSGHRNEIRACMDCPLRGSSRLCDVPDNVLREIDARKRQVSYHAGALLYREGEPSSRAFVICRGEVKLTRTSVDGATIILKIAKAGELLGISEVMTGAEYVATAEAVETSSVACISREQLVAILARHSIAGNRISEFLSSECLDAFVNLFFLRQTSSTSTKLCQFLLRWIQTHPTSSAQWTAIPYTQSEIAQLLGASRETVSRLLNGLQNKRVLEIKRKQLRVINLSALRRTATEYERQERELVTSIPKYHESRPSL